MKTKLLLIAIAMLCLSLNIYADNPIKNTTFVFVHGAWHGSWQWHQLEAKLQDIGFKTVSINLPGHGIEKTPPPDVTLDLYTQVLMDTLESIKGKVILVGHSLGGIVISEVAEAKPNKIDKLVYLSGFLLQNGQTLFSVAAQDSLSLVVPNMVLNEEEGYADINRDSVVNIFYNKSPNNSIILSKSLLTKQPLTPLNQPVKISKKRFGSIPLYYILTKYDKAISPEFQKRMYSAFPQANIYSLNSDHSPFFSKVWALRSTLVQIAFDHPCKKSGSNSELMMPTDISFH